MLGYQEGRQGTQEGKKRIVVEAKQMELILQVAFEEPFLGKTASLSFVSSEDIATQFLLCSGK